MENLSKEQWYEWVQWIKDVKDRDHQDWEIDKRLAKLWWTLAEMSFPKDFFTIIWRTHVLKRAMKLHKRCCDISPD